MLSTVAGCKLYYERLGRPDGKKLLLLHGWGCDGSMFSFIASGLAESADVIVIDFPGHGRSDEPPEPWGVPEYAAQIKAFLEEISVSRVSVIAHSFGGRICIYLASHYPELIDRMLITGSAGIKKPQSEAQRKRTKRFKRYQRLLDGIGEIKPLSHASALMQEKLRMRYGSPDYIKLNENMRKTFVKVISQDLLPMLSDIKAPTLLLWGEEDTETPLWMGREMEERIPDAGLVVFEKAGHFAFVEQWQRFLIIARNFFLEV